MCHRGSSRVWSSWLLCVPPVAIRLRWLARAWSPSLPAGSRQSRKRRRRPAHAHHAGHHARHHHRHHHDRHTARAARAVGFADAQAGFAPNTAPGDTATGRFGAPDGYQNALPFRRVASPIAVRGRRGEARGMSTPRSASPPVISTPRAIRAGSRFINVSPRRAAGRRHPPAAPVWRGRFKLNMVLGDAELRALGFPDMALVQRPRPVRHLRPQVGAIAVMGRTWRRPCSAWSAYHAQAKQSFSRLQERHPGHVR